MLRLYKRDRDKHWKIRGTLHGVQYEESTGLADRAQAEIVLNARIGEINKRYVEGVVLGRPPSPTFAAAVVTYLEKGGERRFLAPLLELFGETPIDRIGQREIDDAARRLLPGRAPATVNRQIYGPMSAVLKATGSSLQVARLKEPKGRVRWLRPDEAQSLVNACSPHLRPLVAFLFSTGARVGEALFLDWRNVDLSRAHVTFERTKNGEARGVPLTAELVAMLANLPTRSGAVFRRPDGRSYSDFRDEGDTSAGSRIKTAFAGACRRAGIADFHPHDCRHTWATWHYERNRDLIGLMHDGGWKSLRMVERYAHVNKDHRRGAYDALPKIEIG